MSDIKVLTLLVIKVADNSEESINNSSRVGFFSLTSILSYNLNLIDFYKDSSPLHVTKLDVSAILAIYS